MTDHEDLELTPLQSLALAVTLIAKKAIPAVSITY